MRCPKCGSRLFDNRQLRKDSAFKHWPAFRCVKLSCGWFTWDEDWYNE